MADDELILRCDSCDELISGPGHVCEKKRDACQKGAHTRASDDLYTSQKTPSWGQRLNAGFNMMADKEDGSEYEEDKEY